MGFYVCVILNYFFSSSSLWSFFLYWVCPLSLIGNQQQQQQQNVTRLQLNCWRVGSNWIRSICIICEFVAHICNKFLLIRWEHIFICHGSHGWWWSNDTFLYKLLFQLNVSIWRFYRLSWAVWQFATIYRCLRVYHSVYVYVTY